MAELIYPVGSADEGLLVRSIALSRLRMSYGQFKRAKFMGEILLDGCPVHANVRVHQGQTLVIRVPPGESAFIAPFAMPLTIPYRDENFCVIDKPAPLPSSSSPRKDTITLENALYSAFGCPEGFIYRPVNRLDKGTSGLMLVALHAHAQQRLQAMLHTDGFTREYLAVCQGAPPAAEGIIDLPIAKGEGATIRREIRQEGKQARTHYRLLRSTGERSLVLLRLDTGRTHQIRVHLQALGCPVTGDFLYGQEHPALPGRFALHSHRVVLQHPFSGQSLALESPLPPELTALLDATP